MPVLRSDFFWFKKHLILTTSKVQLMDLKHCVFNLYQRISSISLGKEKVEFNFINVNDDLN